MTRRAPTRRWPAWRLLVAWCVAWSALSACRDPAALSGTALFVTVDFDETLALNQLRFSVLHDGTLAAGPTTRPEAPAEVLRTGQTIRLLLPDALGATTVDVLVEGLATNTVRGQGVASVVVKRGFEVDVPVVLGNEVGCGLGPACSAGQRCIDRACVCDSTSCPAGCCLGSSCVALSLATCAPYGASCQACDAARADGCSTAGSCQCGSNAACEGGQRCVGGLCVCDSTSCASGCCEGTSCRPRSLGACGSQGASCVACSSAVADNCAVEGNCRCGTTPSCGAGQSCNQGTCVGGSCDGVTCATGCCASGVCQPKAFATCGSGGSACLACDALRADGCSSNGVCGCGAGAQCASGQRCVAGACVCDGASCPSGCCEGTVCTTRSLSTCGTSGRACTACSATTADGCAANGSCSCGSNVACGAGQRCVSGACVCDASGCASGCCSSGACVAASATTCGRNGGACVTCDALRADQCLAGACACGSGALCAVGQRCLAGQCQCDASSCPSGCCDSNGRCNPGTSKQQCGTGGLACVSCGGPAKCMSQRCQ